MASIPSARGLVRRILRPTTIRGRLIGLVLLMLLPTTCVSLASALIVYREERDAVTAAALETAKALSLVADRELAVRAAVLRTLAASGSLSRGDLPAFYAEAKAVVPSIENTIVLSDASGQQLLNTRAPLGSTGLAKSRTLGGVSSPAPGTLIVSDLYMAPLGKQHSFAVHLPVYLDGRLRWYVGMGSFASQLQHIFEQQPLPHGWVGSVLDAKGYLIARNSKAEQMVGKRASEDMLKALALQRSGMHETRTLDGVPVYTVFNRAPDSGWTVLIGLPQSEVHASAWRALAAIAIGTLAITAIALTLALRFARRIADPVLGLHRDALALGEGQPVQEMPTGLAETDAVQRLLARASRERSEVDERLRARVAEALAEAEQAHQAAVRVQKLEALGRLTGGIAHDFNNLLQTMTTGLHLAQRLAKDDRLLACLAPCERAVTKAVKLTRQLMTFGRTQPGNLATIDMKQHLPTTTDLIRGALPDSVDLVVSIDPAVGQVHVDPVQLELAVLNLVLNARDAIAASGTVKVSASNASAPTMATADAAGSARAAEYVVVRVGDDGAGVPTELLPRIFEPFFTTKPIGKGTGLGLAQVYGFAKASGGFATVESEPGKGTEVAIWLPRASSGEETEAATAPAPSQRPEGRYRGVVLLVEDDLLVRSLTSQALEERGFTVVSAATADDALAIARSRNDLDAVLSDVVMPGARSGLDLARALATLRPALPVLLASGYAQASEAHPDFTIIAKPYDVDAVARRLGEFTGAHAEAQVEPPVS